MRVRELAESLGAAFEGDGERPLTGVASLEDALSGDVSFVAGGRAAARAHESVAGCLIVPPAFDNASGRTVIRSTSPRKDFARAVAQFHPARPLAAPGVHPTAVVDPSGKLGTDAAVGPHVTIGAGCRIGAAVEIGAGCAIGAGCTIGDGTRLYPRVTLYDGVTVGRRCILHSGSVIGADGFGFAEEGGRYLKFPQVGRVEIGDDVEIGANACIDRAALGVTSIGEGTKIDNMVHIGHNCRIGKHVVVAAQTGLSGGVVVEDRAVIGGQVGIGDKARIESGAILGSGCGILSSKIVRGGQVVWGTPARPLKQYLEQLALMARLPRFREEMAELNGRLAALEEGECSS
ncbi:MAG: UDP-3-O-(3-hydroxymyristoyl)glucosamine N-acyltransferase [Bryobacterales bacterium]|nr:UDP-3-O-(3-hydroxymyristoyl)glucosamine N-acyltransferase [Bryobacterales bacterium]